MSKNPNASQRIFLYVLLALVLICAVVGIAAWTATSSPVFSLAGIITPPARGQPFAFVKIAKPASALPTNIPLSITLPTEASPASPTSNPDPITLPTEISLASATSTPSAVTVPADSQTFEPTVSAEIVADTPAPEYVAPVSQNADANNASVPSSNGGKYILVVISEQHMYVYEGDKLVYSFVSSTGMNNATRTGMFSVLDKIPSAYGATWDIWMPNWLGIYYAGSMENGIHALPILPNGATLWAGYLGVPISYGCIVLGTNEAQLLYDWADIGTPVEIRR